MMYVRAYLYVPVLLCPLFAWIVPFVVCRAQSYEKLTCFGTNCPESIYAWLKAAPPLSSPFARFRSGFAPTSVLAEDGSVRLWSLH